MGRGCVEGCVGISLIGVAGVGSKAFQEKHGDQKPEVSDVDPSRAGERLIKDAVE